MTEEQILLEWEAKEDLIERFWEVPFHHDVDNDSRLSVVLSWLPLEHMEQMVDHLEKTK
jgi:hypothetical protein